MAKELKRIFDLHRHQLESYPKKDSLMAKVNGEWTGYSTQEFIDTAMKLSLGLLDLGIKPNDKVAIVSNNRPEWHIADLAILQIGAVNVPIYPTITEEDYAFILNDCEAKLVFVSDQELQKKLLNVKNKVASLQEIYCFDELADCIHWTTLLKDGDFGRVESIMDSIAENDLATLIYTSGTTGKPKGVMISHWNLVSNVLASRERLPCDEKSRSLSFLPLCHVYERMVGYLYIYNGVSIYYAESIDTIGENIREVKPQVFTAVPRLLEKIYDKIMAKASELTGIKKALFFWALDLGHQYEIHGKSAWYKFKLAIANKLIFSKWREALGGNALAVASGSAALQPRLARVFLAAKIPVVEGYGLTETAVVVAVNCAKNDGIRIGTVGRPLSNVEVKIAEDGEILVKGPNVMMGYYNNEEATKEVLTEDGWLHTGDIGEFVEGEYLKITDRKKEIFKTSGGKYVAPQVMENKFKESPFIEQIMVIGENRKHPAALVQPAFEFLQEYCKRKGIKYSSDAEVIAEQKIIDRIEKEIERLNANFAQFEKVKKFRLTPSVWSIEGGEVTPTLKLRRKIILEKYKDLVNDIYKDEAESP
jgi:long-chain acyl-CoA synthetase